MYISYIISIFIIMLLSALYSAAETSITSLSQPLLHKLKEDGNKKAILICQLRENKEMLLSSLLIASSALDTIGSAVAISLAVKIGGVSMIPIATLIMTIVVILFADIIPKTFAFEHSKRTAFFTAYFVKYSVIAFYPFTKLVQFLVKMIFKFFQIRLKNKVNENNSGDVLRGAIAMGRSLGYLLKEDKQMLDGILDLSECNIKSVMTPISDVCSLNIEMPADVMLNYMLETGHSRFPVWDEKQQEILGVMYLKDLFCLIQKGKSVTRKNIEKILLSPWFVSEENILSRQLREFRKKKIHFAVVNNDNNFPVGIVSLEDILEEIVGNIYDEHDALKDSIQKVGKGCYIVKPSIKVKEVNRYLGWQLTAPKSKSLASLIQMGGSRVNLGDVFTAHGFSAEILSVQNNKIQKIKIKKATI